MDEDKKCDDRKYAGTVVLEKTSVNGKKGGNAGISSGSGGGMLGRKKKRLGLKL